MVEDREELPVSSDAPSPEPTADSPFGPLPLASERSPEVSPEEPEQGEPSREAVLIPDSSSEATEDEQENPPLEDLDALAEEAEALRAEVDAVAQEVEAVEAAGGGSIHPEPEIALESDSATQAQLPEEVPAETSQSVVLQADALAMAVETGVITMVEEPEASTESEPTEPSSGSSGVPNPAYRDVLPLEAAWQLNGFSGLGLTPAEVLETDDEPRRVLTIDGPFSGSVPVSGMTPERLTDLRRRRDEALEAWLQAHAEELAPLLAAEAGELADAVEGMVREEPASGERSEQSESVSDEGPVAEAESASVDADADLDPAADAAEEVAEDPPSELVADEEDAGDEVVSGVVAEPVAEAESGVVAEPVAEAESAPVDADADLDAVADAAEEVPEDPPSELVAGEEDADDEVVSGVVAEPVAEAESAPVDADADLDAVGDAAEEVPEEAPSELVAGEEDADDEAVSGVVAEPVAEAESAPVDADADLDAVGDAAEEVPEEAPSELVAGEEDADDEAVSGVVAEPVAEAESAPVDTDADLDAVGDAAEEASSEADADGDVAADVVVAPASAEQPADATGSAEVSLECDPGPTGPGFGDLADAFHAPLPEPAAEAEGNKPEGPADDVVAKPVEDEEAPDPDVGSASSDIDEAVPDPASTVAAAASSRRNYAPSHEEITALLQEHELGDLAREDAVDPEFAERIRQLDEAVVSLEGPWGSQVREPDADVREVRDEVRAVREEAVKIGETVASVGDRVDRLSDEVSASSRATLATVAALQDVRDQARAEPTASSPVPAVVHREVIVDEGPALDRPLMWTGAAVLLVSWAVTFYVKTGDLRLTLGGLVFANFAGCAAILFSKYGRV